MTPRCQFLVDTLDLPEASQYEGAKWEYFQLAHLNSDSLFRIENKSRQIAWSFLIAAEAVAEAILEGQSSMFISINLPESQEKIRYAKTIYHNIKGVRIPPIVRNTQLGIELANGARILSLFSPRGKPGFNVYLDEFAHFIHDQGQYKAALPVISKGGRLRVGSSPAGGSGVFWEIYSQAMKPYSRYERKVTPWWEVYAFSSDPLTAIKEAPLLDTEERVNRFGTDIIVAIYESMVLEDFQQEYECAFVDENVSWITWSEIKNNTIENLKCVVEKAIGQDMVTPRLAIKKLLGMIEREEIETALGGGVDIGRKHDATEIVLGGETAKNYPVRLVLTLSRMPFEEQEGILKMMMEELPIHTLLIDRNGIGMQLAETMERHTSGMARGVDFTLQSKQLWATDSKMLIQKGKTPLPNDRDLKYQIHSIKRKVSSSNNMIFDAEKNEKHHADKFWAWALALQSLTRMVGVIPQTAVRSFS